MAARFTGVWPAMVTPMHDDGGLRLESIPALVEKFVREGAGGLYLCGSTGQWPFLTMEERRAVAEATLAAAAGRLPVMVHVGALRIEDEVALAKHAADSGAAAVSSIAPIYYGPSLRAAMDYYRRIAEATDLPFYAYNFAVPGCTADEYADALLSLPNIGGLKFTSRDTYELARLKIASEGRLNVLSGADESFLSAAAQGADGAIGSTQNIGMPLFLAVECAARDGRWAEARRLMLDLVRLVHDVTITHHIAGLHAVLSAEDIPCGTPRHWLPTVDAANLPRCLAAYRSVMERFLGARTS